VNANTRNAGEPTVENLLRWLLGLGAAIILGPILLLAALVLIFIACPPLLIAVWWTWTTLAPYADVLLVQVAAPVALALLWRRHGGGQRAKGGA